VDPKSRTQKKTEEARAELQNPDMEKFDRAMRALLKGTDGEKSQRRKRLKK
jgi:hypothetical protein